MAFLGAKMYRIAVISFHGCPVARLGEEDTGGMNVYVLQLANELGRRGHLVDVYTRYHDPADPQVVHLGEGVRVIHLEAGPYGEPKANLHTYLPQFIGNLSRFQQAENLDYHLVHSHYWLSGRAGITLSQSWSIPHVTTFHTLAEIKIRARSGEKESSLRKTSEKRVMDQVDAVVVSSAHEKQEMVRLYGASPHKIHVVAPGVDGDLFQPMEKVEAKRQVGLENKRVILSVGRIEPLKGLSLLLQAFAELEDREGVKLLVVGGQEKSRELNRLRSLAGELGIQEEVSFLGAMKQKELPVYYSAADVFVMPSYYESFGLAALEAMSCGTPVIASRVGGLQSLVDDGVNGYLVSWRCATPYTYRLETLLSNEDLRHNMGMAAREKARAMSWGLTAEKIVELFDCLIEPSLNIAAGD